MILAAGICDRQTKRAPPFLRLPNPLEQPCQCGYHRGQRGNSRSRYSRLTRAAVRAGHSQFAGGQGGEFGELHCKLGHTVRIEPGLRPRSPKNGNFSNIRRRLSAILLSECRKSEPGDWWPIRKSPPLVGLSGISGGKISERQTGWLGREDSNLDMANWNRMLSPVREEPQNLFSSKLISHSKRWNFENRTESAESRASERNGPFGE
jgi:hypothetical protein